MVWGRILAVWKWFFMGLMGYLGGMGVNNAELSFFSSEQNKNSSTLFKISSEIKNFCSELFALISEAIFHTSKILHNAAE